MLQEFIPSCVFGTYFEDRIKLFWSLLGVWVNFYRFLKFEKRWSGVLRVGQAGGAGVQAERGMGREGQLGR